MVLPLEPTEVPGVHRRGSRFVAVYRAAGRQHKESAATLAEARAIKLARQRMPASGGVVRRRAAARRDEAARRLELVPSADRTRLALSRVGSPPRLYSERDGVFHAARSWLALGGRSFSARILQ
jgi:hypothetical protein